MWNCDIIATSHDVKKRFLSTLPFCIYLEGNNCRGNYRCFYSKSGLFSPWWGGPFLKETSREPEAFSERPKKSSSIFHDSFGPRMNSDDQHGKKEWETGKNETFFLFFLQFARKRIDNFSLCNFSRDLTSVHARKKYVSHESVSFVRECSGPPFANVRDRKIGRKRF